MLARFSVWPRSRKVVLAAGATALLLASLAWWRFERFYVRLVLESPRTGRCDKRLNRALLDRSLQLGTSYLLRHQRREGNFDYEYDWREGEDSEEDQETRQAGALWGVTLLFQETKTTALSAAIERGLSFFDSHSTQVGELRCTAYPGSRSGSVGTVALVALAYIEYLRAATDLPLERRAELSTRLDEYLKMLRKSRHPSGLWHGSYEVATCRATGEPSSYTDGEALLALVKAAKYLERKDLLPVIESAAASGKRLNIERALATDADSDVTKGYYQWSSMAFYELATSDFPNMKSYGEVLLRLADWIIDEHGILMRNRNTGYAFEGITLAYAFAKQQGDAVRQAKYGCIIDVGLEHLLSWQVGSPLANRFTSNVSPTDRDALGGIQNGAFDPALRIDVTQHQLHATQLARQFVY